MKKLLFLTVALLSLSFVGCATTDTTDPIGTTNPMGTTDPMDTTNPMGTTDPIGNTDPMESIPPSDTAADGITTDMNGIIGDGDTIAPTN